MNNRLFSQGSIAALLIAIFGWPAACPAQSILLTAGDFTILGGTAVTSTGTTGTIIINGNVGSGVAVSGFPPAVVQNGQIFGPGAVVNQALLDLGKAQVGLAGMASTANESGTDMGGLTLLPGVYTFDIAAALDGALTLDANNENGAFWVFQIGTSLTTNLGSTVTMINPGTNGGKDDSIFWNAGAGITLGANSQLLGNYLAGTSITFGGTTSGTGRALAQAGVSLDTNQDNPIAPNGGDWTGGLVYNTQGQVVPSMSVPEPAAFLWLVPLCALTLAFWKRRQSPSPLIA